MNTKQTISHREYLPYVNKRRKAGSETSRTIDVSKSKHISPTHSRTIEVKHGGRYNNFSTY